MPKGNVKITPKIRRTVEHALRAAGSHDEAKSVKDVVGQVWRLTGKPLGLTRPQVYTIFYEMADVPVRTRGANAHGWGVPFTGDEISRYVTDLKALGADEDRYVESALYNQVGARHGVDPRRVARGWRRHLKGLGKLTKRDPLRTLVDLVVRRLDRFTKAEMDRFFRELKKALETR